MFEKLEALTQEPKAITTLLYCVPGGGKSTALGLIAEKSNKKMLVLDVDKTITNTLSKKDVVKNIANIDIRKIDQRNTWNDYTDAIKELVELKEQGKLDYDYIAIDNVSELERCILADLGRQGKNKGIPAMADYQYMQFKLVDSLRALKNLGKSVVLTAWEAKRDVVDIDGTTYTMICPSIQKTILDNICGLCDVVGRITSKRDNGEVIRGIVLEGTQTVYAKNQIDTRKGCLVEDYVKGE